MQGLLAACLAKIQASEDHLYRFQQATERFFEGKNEVAPLTAELNPQRTKYVFRVEDVIEWPAVEWGIIIGDAVHCLRSALDQLVYGLAREPGKRTAFPVCLTEREWVTDAPSRYWSVRPVFVRLIDKAQPYHRGDAASEHPLALLSALSNLDKHRTIPTIALVPDNNKGEILSKQGIANWPRIRFKTGAIYEPGAVVAEAKIVPDQSGLEPQMQVKITSTFDVAFGRIPGAPSLRNKRVLSTFNDEIGTPIVKGIFNPFVEAWNEVVRNAERDAREGGEANSPHD